MAHGPSMPCPLTWLGAYPGVKICNKQAPPVSTNVITICDTGPLVAYLNRNDLYHGWAVGLMKQIRPPMRTCEAVLTEVAYFLREDGLDADPLFQLLERDAMRVHFDLSTHWPRVRTLMARYERMDLADASIVVMTELHKRCQVLTLDRKDFSIYRRNDRQTIDFIAPEAVSRETVPNGGVARSQTAPTVLIPLL